MPNTFSMPPGYVRRFVERNRLRRVERNVFQIIREKLLRLFRQNSVFQTIGIVTRADAKALSTVACLREYVGEVDLVVTSPPYLDVVEYARQNWIRMWFLNEDPVQVSEQLDDTHTLERWLDFIEAVSAHIKRMLRPDGVAVLVIGDITRSANTVISPGREAIRRLYYKCMFRYIGCMNDGSYKDEKTTRVWKNTKGQATSVDRILILSDTIPQLNFRELDNDLFKSTVAYSAFCAADLADYARSFAGLADSEETGLSATLEDGGCKARSP